VKPIYGTLLGPTITRDMVRTLLEWKRDRRAAHPHGFMLSHIGERVGTEYVVYSSKGALANAGRAKSSSPRAALGITDADVTEVRDILARAGSKLKRAEVEDLVAQTLANALRATDTTAAARKRAQRVRARAAGRCIVNPAHVAAPGRATCDECNAAAHRRQRGEPEPGVDDACDDWNPADVF